MQIQDNVVDLTARSGPYPDIVQERAAWSVAVVPPEATALVGWCADPKFNVVDLTAHSCSYLGVQIQDVGSHPVVQKPAALVVQWLDAGTGMVPLSA